MSKTKSPNSLRSTQTETILNTALAAAIVVPAGIAAIKYNQAHPTKQHEQRVKQAKLTLEAHQGQHPESAKVAKIRLTESGLVWDAAKKLHEQTGQDTGEAAYNIDSYLPGGRNSFTHKGEVITVHEDSEGHVTPSSN